MPKLSKTGWQIGSSDAGAIVIYKTAWDTRDTLLFKHKRARAGFTEKLESKSTPATRRGTHLEKGVADWAKVEISLEIDAHVEIEEPTKPFVIEELGIASSIDRFITLHAPYVLKNRDGSEIVLQGKGICEIKTDGYHQDRPKPEWVIQVLHQMLCSNMTWGLIAVLDQKLSLKFYPVAYNKVMIERMKEAYAEFWDLVENDGEYPPILENKEVPQNIDDFDPVVTRELSDLCRSYSEASRQASEAAKIKDDVKSAILDALDGLEENHVAVGNYVIKYDETMREKKIFKSTGEFVPSTRFTLRETT